MFHEDAAALCGVFLMIEAHNMSQYISLALVISFSMFTTCAFVFFISGAYLLIFKIDQTNRMFKHPYLREKPFKQYPFSIRMKIILDYFLRLMFPNRNVGLAGQANQLLRHVDIDDIPWNIRWPIVGLWSGSALGMIAMLVLWALVLSGAAK